VKKQTVAEEKQQKKEKKKTMNNQNNQNSVEFEMKTCQEVSQPMATTSPSGVVTLATESTPLSTVADNDTDLLSDPKMRFPKTRFIRVPILFY